MSILGSTSLGSLSDPGATHRWVVPGTVRVFGPGLQRCMMGVAGPGPCIRMHLLVPVPQEKLPCACIMHGAAS